MVSPVAHVSGLHKAVRSRIFSILEAHISSVPREVNSSSVHHWLSWINHVAMVPGSIQTQTLDAPLGSGSSTCRPWTTPCPCQILQKLSGLMTLQNPSSPRISVCVHLSSFLPISGRLQPHIWGHLSGVEFTSPSPQREHCPAQGSSADWYSSDTGIIYFCSPILFTPWVNSYCSPARCNSLPRDYSIQDLASMASHILNSEFAGYIIPAFKILDEHLFYVQTPLSNTYLQRKGKARSHFHRAWLCWGPRLRDMQVGTFKSLLFKRGTLHRGTTRYTGPPNQCWDWGGGASFHWISLIQLFLKPMRDWHQDTGCSNTLWK